jgi:hypothetical protein
MALLRNLGMMPLREVRCPTLVVHGTHDADVKFCHGARAHEYIPGAHRVWIEDGSHLGFWLSPTPSRRRTPHEISWIEPCATTQGGNRAGDRTPPPVSSRPRPAVLTGDGMFFRLPLIVPRDLPPAAQRLAPGYDASDRVCAPDR